jgi:hypothetical protein
METSFRDKMQALRDDLDATQQAREAFSEDLKIRVSEVRTEAHNLLGRIRINQEEARERRAEARTQLHWQLAGMAQHRKELGDDLRAGGQVFHKRG